MGGWEVKSMHCSSREPQFKCRHPRGSSELPMTPSPEASATHWHALRHTYIHAIKSNTITPLKRKVVVFSMKNNKGQQWYMAVRSCRAGASTGAQLAEYLVLPKPWAPSLVPLKPEGGGWRIGSLRSSLMTWWVRGHPGTEKDLVWETNTKQSFVS